MLSVLRCRCAAMLNFRSTSMAVLPTFLASLLFICALCNAIDVQYDEDLARKMVGMSAAAYSTSPNECLKSAAFPAADNWTLATNVNDKCDILKDTCAVVIAISDNNQQISIAFRGTNTKGQLFLEALDSIAPEEDFNGLGSVHQYFKNGLNDVWSYIEKTLKNDKTKNYVVIFSGHSLGGALASLAAIQTVQLKLRTSDQVKLFTYGQPRVGDSTFAFNHDRLVPYSFRIVHQADIVPHVPKCKQGSNGCVADDKSYYHHGIEVWYPDGMGDGGKGIVCTGSPKNEDSSCSDSLHEEAGYSTSDHYLYFEHDVWQYGENGCVDDGSGTKAPSTSEFLQIRNALINHFQHFLTGK